MTVELLLNDDRTPSSLDDLELETTGTFEECIEHAQNTIAEAGGGQVTVHRSLPVEHVNSSDCPCRPVVIDGITLRPAEDIHAEIEESDG